MFGVDDAIGAGVGIIGGIFQRRAAKKAAEAQARAAEAAAQRVTDASTRASGLVANAASEGATSADQAAQQAADRVDSYTLSANKLLDPYAAAGATAVGALQKGVAEGGDFNRNPTMADIQIDPGYDFRLNNGINKLARFGAAHGAIGGGGFQKDLVDYQQGSNSQEFGAASDRYQRNLQARLGALMNVTGIGQQAVTAQGGNLMDSGKYGADVAVNANKFGTGLKFDAAQYSGNNDLQSTIQGNDYRLQGANAKAAGDVAGSNALWGGIAGATNAAVEGGLASKLLKRKNYFDPMKQMRSIPITPRTPFSFA